MPTHRPLATVAKLAASAAPTRLRARACEHARMHARTCPIHVHARTAPLPCPLPLLCSHVIIIIITIRHNHHHPLRQHHHPVRFDIKDTERHRTCWSWTQADSDRNRYCLEIVQAACTAAPAAFFSIISEDDEVSNQALSSVSQAAGTSMLFSSQTAHYVHRRHFH